MILLSVVTSFAFADDKSNQPLNVQYTSAAWNAFNAAKYEEAIRLAGQCINEFRHNADRMQSELKKKNPNPLPVGKVSDTERDAILNNGPLNDVATCYFIQGEAYKKLSDQAEGEEKQRALLQAKAAYEKAAPYTYARTWDPNGWFWDPSQTAIDRLSDLPPLRSQ